ncbi:MAG: ribonuclease E/G [Kiloniellales bacterium]|nr:ribonuclease E/G [Kiloniellales bacterium]
MKLLISAQPGELRAAWIDGGRLVDLVIQRDDHPSRLGEIHLGRVSDLDRGLGAAFVDLGLERAGFLPLSEAPGVRLTEGATVTVRVLRDATPEKGPRLTARLIDAPPDLAQLSRDAKSPCRLLPGGDPVTRLLTAERPPEEILVDHPETFGSLKARAMAVRPELGALIGLDLGAEPLFEREVITFGPEGDTVEAAIDALLAPRVALPGGGVLWIEPTHGLVAIDVDSGRQAAGAAQDLALAVNLEAAAEIPRQLRLRALSGQIVIDFLELKDIKTRKRVVAALRAGLKGDREPLRVRAMAASGLAVMTRRRGAPALHEILTAPCGDGGSGRRKTAATLAFEALRAVRQAAVGTPEARVAVQAEPAVLAALDGVAGRARAELENRLGWKLAHVSAELTAGSGYEIVTDVPKAGRG